MSKTEHLSEREALVVAEQVRIVYQGISAGIFATFLNSIILSYVQWAVVDHAVLFGWLGYMALVSGSRLVLVYRYNRRPVGAENAALWQHRFISGAAFAASGWGLAAYLLMPEGHIPQQFVTILVMAGTVAGATSTLAAVQRASVLFTLITLLPLFVKLLLLGGTLYQSIALFTVIFAFFMFSASRRNHETLATSLRLNFDNTELLHRLEGEKAQAYTLNNSLKKEIAQRLSAELQLKRREMSLEEAQRIAHLGSWEWDCHTDQVSLSQQMQELLRLEPGNWRISYPAALNRLHPQDRERVEAARRHAIAQRHGYSVEYRVGTGEGRDTILEEQAVPRMNEEGSCVGLSAIALDVTQRKEMDRLKRDFISVVSHELRTPLTSINGTLGLLMGGVAGELAPKARDLVEVAQRNATRLVHLVNDILDIDKLEFGGLPLDLAELDLVKVVHDALEENYGYADKLGVALSLTAAPTGLPLTGDRDRLIQVLTNLLSNAAKYSPPQGVVEVSIQPQAGRVRVAVQDHGPGIAESFRGKVFQKFCQGDTSDARFQYGTGLGLNIAKLIIEKHHGRIGFDTEVGKGTTFWFDLPLADQG